LIVSPQTVFMLKLPVASVSATAARVTDPQRTATEQFLLSQAAVEAVARLSFDPLRGRRVWVDDRYFAAADAPFVLGQLRAKMLIDGLRLVEEREEAQVVLEVRSGGVGIDRYDYLLGIPAIALTQNNTAAGEVPLLTPELAIFKNLRQRAYASVAFVAYWTDSGELISRSGPFVGRTIREDYWIFGTGPRTVGNIAPTEKPQ
jgi:hypothetical protein